ncbi:carboxymuconolactone decarboxylase family protein [Segnochrobactraceae bacterium EtOH-i3]
MQHSFVTDVIERLAGLARGSHIDSLRTARPDVVRALQESHRALFEPKDLGQLPRSEREAAALRASVLIGHPVLAAFHRDRLARLGFSPDIVAAVEAGPGPGPLAPRTISVLAFVDHVTLTPARPADDARARLFAASLDAGAVVALTGVIAFTALRARLLIGLDLLGDAP